MGARNMMGIGVATAAAGIIVGTVTLTGLSSRFIEAIEIISLGNVVLMLLLVAMTSLILGMGLPTTANYIVMATLTAPIIVTLGAKADLVIPLLAAHLFVFYFGILADDTPPVGLAAFAASAIAKSDPIQTGIQGFIYDLRTAILPFVFIFNLELLMISGVGPKGEIIWITDLLKITWICVASLVAMFSFASALQGIFRRRVLLGRAGDSPRRVRGVFPPLGGGGFRRGQSGPCPASRHGRLRWPVFSPEKKASFGRRGGLSEKA